MKERNMKELKVAVNTNSLRKNFSNAEMVALIKSCGAGGIEWGMNGLEGLQEECREMIRLTEDAGLQVISFINGGKLLNTEEMKRWTETVAASGVKTMRVAHPWYAYNFEEALHQPDNYLDLLKMTRDGLERIEELGRQSGLRYVMETHGSSVFASPVVAHYLLAGLDPAVFGVIYDPANTYIEGFVRPRGAAEVIGPYMSYVHVKNIRWKEQQGLLLGERQRQVWRPEKCHLDEGLVDYQEVFFAMNCIGFEGWYSFEEMFSQPDQVAAEIRRGIEHLKLCREQAPLAPREPFKSFNY
jgi:sugar phosphate isomerase/epimerase